MPKLQEVVEALRVSISERLRQNENKDTIVASAQHDLSGWIAWPQRALLLWEGCVRKGKRLPAEWVMPAEWVNEWITHSGRNAYQYVYPPELDSLLRHKQIPRDRHMNNGPPRTAFLLAGGKCPKGWRHHHLYDGNDECHPKNAVKPLHAAYHPLHFTQSAGIVATTKEAHDICHNTDDSLRSLLRQVTWLKFGYDPDKRFAMQPIHDGFEEGYSFENVYPKLRQ